MNNDPLPWYIWTMIGVLFACAFAFWNGGHRR